MKKTMVYVLALTFAFSAMLAGCGDSKTTGKKDDILPSPHITEDMPDVDDGIVNDNDGVITDGDNGGVTGNGDNHSGTGAGNGTGGNASDNGGMGVGGAN